MWLAKNDSPLQGPCNLSHDAKTGLWIPSCRVTNVTNSLQPLVPRLRKSLSLKDTARTHRVVRAAEPTNKKKRSETTCKVYLEDSNNGFTPALHSTQTSEVSMGLENHKAPRLP